MNAFDVLLRAENLRFKRKQLRQKRSGWEREFVNSIKVLEAQCASQMRGRLPRFAAQTWAHLFADQCKSLVSKTRTHLLKSTAGWEQLLQASALKISGFYRRRGFIFENARVSFRGEMEIWRHKLRFQRRRIGHLHKTQDAWERKISFSYITLRNTEIARREKFKLRRIRLPPSRWPESLKMNKTKLIAAYRNNLDPWRGVLLRTHHNIRFRTFAKEVRI